MRVSAECESMLRRSARVAAWSAFRKVQVIVPVGTSQASRHRLDGPHGQLFPGTDAVSMDQTMGNRLPSKIHPKLRVAVVQAAPEFLDLDGTIDKTIDFMRKAARERATLIAF